MELTKGGVGELALANHLGHTLVDGDKDADGFDDDGKMYEYKYIIQINLISTSAHEPCKME